MKNFLPIIAVAAILMVPIMSAYGTGIGGSAPPVIGSVTINAVTCGISASPAGAGATTGLNYGSINPGVTAQADHLLIIQNNGNVPTTSVTVTASDWFDAATANAVEHIKAENTAFTLDATLSPASWIHLSPTTIVGGATVPGTTPITSAIPPVSDINAYWQLTANLDNTPFSGALTQTMTFTSGC